MAYSINDMIDALEGIKSLIGGDKEVRVAVVDWSSDLHHYDSAWLSVDAVHGQVSKNSSMSYAEIEVNGS